MNAAAERFPRGTLIDGRYQIRDHLGQGGMGTVYRARDTKMGQSVAIKMLRQAARGERSLEERRRRFMNEIYAINEVAHRNVVQVLEFGFHDGTPFMVMELLEGKDLSRVIHDEVGFLPIDYCVDVILAVCAGIQACHHKGIIHRDLKPGNIMVVETDSGPGWDVKVLDFSISSVGRVAADLTRDGQIVGTPRYLSPEQIEGKALPASDQYAIGLLLHVCLTRTHPFAALEGIRLMRAVARGEIRRPRAVRPEIPAALEEVILTATSVDPDDRFVRVHDLGRALSPFGSPLGQGVWKKYYLETPPELRADDTALMSTATIPPLVLQMAKGDVPVSMKSTTAVANDQRTTAVAGTLTAVPGTTTVDDVEARGEAEGAGTSRDVTRDDREVATDDPEGPSVPTGWSWQSSVSGISQIAGLSASSGTAGPSRSRRAIVGGALILAAAIAVGASRVPAREPLRWAPQPRRAAAAAPVEAPPAVKAAAAPARPQVAPEAAPKVKRRERARQRPQPVGGRWEVDQTGVPILPAEPP